MSRKRWTKDPRKGIAPERLEEIRKLYQGSDMPGREIAQKVAMSHDRLYAIIKWQGWPLRGYAFAITGSRRRMGKKRTIGTVFGGMSKLDLPKVDSHELELAKTRLRQQGRVVYNATVDGSGPKGFVKCDGRLYTAEQIIQRAAQ